MITFMCKIICITNRKLCEGDFLRQIELIARSKPAALVLREKDLSPQEYRELAKRVMRICEEYDVTCILHSFTDIAAELGAKAIHLPLQMLLELPDETKKCFDVIGASCHSADDAILAQKSGATYVTAGHVFATDCKKGLPPRGLDFLRDVCESVDIPVYAIGGISSDNFSMVCEAGADGACVMSGLMTCSNPKDYLSKFREENNIE